MNKKQKLAALASCMVMCSAGFAAVAGAEETGQNNDNVVLEEVVVTAAAFKQLNPVKFTVITEEEIKAKGAQTAAEALKDVTGLYVTTNNTKGKATAQFRGSSAENTKIYVDGVPLSPVGDGKVDLSCIPADNIAKIEVIKGAVPVIYGTDAPGGVIYITTKKAPEKTATALSVSTGSYNDEHYYLSAGGKQGKVSYNFGYKNEETEGYTEHAAEKGDYFNGKISWDISPKSSLTVFGSYSDVQKELPNRINPVTGQIYLNRGQGGTITGKNSFWSGSMDWEYDYLRNSYIGALYNFKLNARNELNFKIYQSNEKSNLKAYGCYWETTDIGGSNLIWDWQHQQWDGTVKGWELQHTIKTSNSNTATWGYAYETRNFTEFTDQVDVKLRADYDYTGKSFYIQDITKINRKLSTYVGYRHYENEDYADINTCAYANPGPQYGKGTSDNPVFSFNYALSGTTNLHGSIGTSYRWPNAKERSGPGGVYGASDQWVVYDHTLYYIWPDGSLHEGVVSEFLLPEEAVNRELGVGYASHGFKFDVTFFKKDIDNMIKGQGFGQGHTQYYNIPHVDMQGYEVEINKNIRNGLKAFFHYTYTDAFDTLVRMQVRDIPSRKFSFGLNYTGQDGVNANLLLNYNGKRTSAFSNGDGNGNSDNPTNLITQTLPSFMTVDLRVAKKKGDRDYWAKILNLFDKKYNQGAFLIAPGRYIEVGTTIKF